MGLKKDQVKELLYQALETERGGQLVYRAAIENAANQDLKKEWQGYLSETEEHEDILLGVFEAFQYNPDERTPGAEIVRMKAETLVKTMQMARKAGDPVQAELVAAEAVVEAETKDHQNWELISELAEEMTGKQSDVLREAYEQVAEQEAHHLFHTMGWARELWIQALGMPAVLPPPEEERQVKTAIGASRAEQAREEML